MGRPGIVPFRTIPGSEVHPFALGPRTTTSIRWILAAMALVVSLYQLHWLGMKSLGSTPPPCDQTQTCLVVDGSELKPMSPVMWGIAFEEINHAGEGGLFVEMLRDRSFEGRAYLLTHPDVVPAKTVPNQGAPPPARSRSRLQAASMDPTSVASAKMMDLHAWLFSNNIVASMHAVSDPPGLHACCVRIEGADKDPESVGQVVNTGHTLGGIALQGGKPYRLRMRVQGVVDDLQVVLTSGDGSETFASLRFPSITQQPLAARSRTLVTEAGLASHGAQVGPHRPQDNQQEDEQLQDVKDSPQSRRRLLEEEQQEQQQQQRRRRQPMVVQNVIPLGKLHQLQQQQQRERQVPQQQQQVQPRVNAELPKQVEGVQQQQQLQQPLGVKMDKPEAKGVVHPAELQQQQPRTQEQPRQDKVQQQQPYPIKDKMQQQQPHPGIKVSESAQQQLQQEQLRLQWQQQLQQKQQQQQQQEQGLAQQQLAQQHAAPAITHLASDLQRSSDAQRQQEQHLHQQVKLQETAITQLRVQQAHALREVQQKQQQQQQVLKGTPKSPLVAQKVLDTKKRQEHELQQQELQLAIAQLREEQAKVLAALVQLQQQMQQQQQQQQQPPKVDEQQQHTVELQQQHAVEPKEPNLMKQPRHQEKKAGAASMPPQAQHSGQLAADDQQVLGHPQQQEQQEEQMQQQVLQQLQEQAEEGKHMAQAAEEQRRYVLEEMQQMRREEEARRKAEEVRRQQALELHPHLQQQLVQGDDVGSDSLGGIWHEIMGLMTPSHSTLDARLAIRFTGAGYLCIEWVSLMPDDAWSPPKADAGDNTKDSGDEDADSVDENAQVDAAIPATLRFTDKPYPFNRALVKALSEMQPQFIRFPGGAFVEGVDLGTALRWKSTVGPAERRPGHPNANWGYWSTDGLGLFEFMELAEELDTEPVWVVNVGISQSESSSPDQLISDGWLQDTLDALEFMLLDVRPEHKWASLRASMGRVMPWSLTYITLGNEECLRPWYAQHYERVASAIRARYPQLQLIANCDLGPGFDYAAWEFHTYRDAGSTFRLRSLFDEYQGPPIAVTEFAAMTSTETVLAAIAEAGFMTAMERNSDKFMLGAFAPLLGHAQLRSWRPNLIVHYSDGSWYGTPSYEVQKLFMNAAGSYSGQVSMQGLVNHNMDASMVCRDELCSSFATKIVNFSPNATEVQLRLAPRPLSKVLDRFSPGMMHHRSVAKLPLWELSSQNPSTDSNDFMKPPTFFPREKYSVIRSIGRGWRQAVIRLPPFSMVLVEVKDIEMV